MSYDTYLHPPGRPETIENQPGSGPINPEHETRRRRLVSALLI